MEEPLDGEPTRRSLRRTALTEINDITNGVDAHTPKSTSPDEQIILQRGRRRKPLTWSPYEYDRSRLFGPPRDKTPEKTPSPKPEISSKLRRRLIMTPEKGQREFIGEAIARRLRSFTKAREEIGASALEQD